MLGGTSPDRSNSSSDLQVRSFLLGRRVRVKLRTQGRHPCIVESLWKIQEDFVKE